MTAYYNEIDPYAAQWLRNLISAGHIAPGDVDERSIVDVQPDDLRGYTQCHFFAGIGGWSHALRLAGWADDREVWTGSCPCQPLSIAGQQKGHADERHLWPAFYSLIAECRPAVVFGEQVASADGREWLSGIRADLEDLGYACGASDMCAAGVGAPHIRQRIYWMANANDTGLEGRRQSGRERSAECPSGARGVAGWMADADKLNGDRSGFGSGDDRREQQCSAELPISKREVCAVRATESYWGNADRLRCRDGRWRPVEPGSFPLAHGISARVGRLRAYGNAIVPQVAAEVIGAYMEIAA